MVEFNCESCGARVKAPPSLAGKTGKCPKCGTLNRVPLFRPAPSQISPAAVTPDSMNLAGNEGCNSSVHQDPGFLYVLVNSAMLGLIKVGKTQRDPDSRAQELSGVTDIPTPFVVAYHEWFSDCSAAEDCVHAILEANGCRVADNREFFSAPVKVAIQAIVQAKAKQRQNEPEEPRMRDAPTDEYAGDGGATPEPWSDLLAQAEDAHYGLGDAVEDEDEAARLYKQAARLGSGKACVALGQLYLTEHFGSDHRAAIKWFNEAVHRGVVEGYSELALLYLDRREGENACKCFAKYSGHIEGQPDTFLDYIFNFLITAARNGMVLSDLGGAEKFRDQIIEHRSAVISRINARHEFLGFMEADLLRVRYMLYGSVPDQRQFGKIKLWDQDESCGLITVNDGVGHFFEQYQIVEGDLPPCVGQPVSFVPGLGKNGPLACVVCLLSH